MRFPFEVEPTKADLRKIVRNALIEDIGKGDITTTATVGQRTLVEARLRLKDKGVIAGLPVVESVFATFDPRTEIRPSAREGGSYGPGRLLARIRGRARSILTCERVALNFVQRLSGIATLTRRFVEAVSGTGVRIIDTRKTTPGLRVLEKYAVVVGGGYNHRPTLGDLAMIKDNHIKAAGGIEEAVRRVRRSGAGVMIEVEVGPDVDLQDLEDLDVDIIMLDNWPLRRLRQAIRAVRQMRSKPNVEVSGGVKLGNVKSIARCGPDFISIGYLTHSARSLDISLDF